MFDDIRETLRSLSGRPDPDERRRMATGMREALVHAKLGIKALQDGLATTDTRLAAERQELETVRRRQALAAGIGDQETVAIAERFAQQHAERVAMLESKRMVQQQEALLAERDYDAMLIELRRIQSGLSPQAGSPERDAMREVDALLADDPLLADATSANGAPGDAPMGAAGGDAPPRRTRAQREADADARLADMKRKLGK